MYGRPSVAHGKDGGSDRLGCSAGSFSDRAAMVRVRGGKRAHNWIVRMSRRIVAGVLAGTLIIAGCGDDDDTGSSVSGGGEVSRPTSAEDLVNQLYGALADNDPATACALFSPSGQSELIEGTQMPTCDAAVDSIAQQIVDPEAFASPTIEIDDPDARELDEWCSTGIHVSVSEGALADPAAVAAFGYTRQSDGTWQVTSYNTQTCG